ncbi:MAG: hypothetical protein ABF679_10065 [Lentilactobacillus diolivorans]|uniref:Uncharacterized protein n=2 Tax=Lentilactobacillus diolivorans TaxID=179838 RepID=A0A0R1SC23_9LACO|nr:hypothetical protein [Lentilactobacillus diolivorans]KRL62859.1 hypothetical protein FC85_GL001726 [Lentilactobacillus diolivorans DSM 14421]MDH5107273.1 hypothetical protein [Lentilactobacillus diolivorans]GEP23446.1 hypothetical protein LDI01_10390 [Lentilactobacillus diolivorans]
METLYDQLRTAQIDESLINAFQNDSDIVYTGIIQFLSSTDFIMLTYNDYGLQDGEVYLKISSVKSVETDSYDLANIKERISFDEVHHLSANPSFDLPIKMSDTLFDRVVQTLHEDTKVALVITIENGKLTYNEGLIQELQPDHLTFLNLNKFDFSKRPVFDIPYTDIRGIEFGGTELKLLEDALSLIDPKNHVEDVTVTDPDQFVVEAEKLRKSGQWLIIDTNDKRRYFYVGQIIASNSRELVMMVVDMNGQFGGYVWIRYDDIKRFITDADYLKIIDQFVKVNKAAKNFALPVLNADRAFDNADDILVHVLTQAIQYHRLIRFEMTNQDNFVGYPTNFDFASGLVTVELLDVDEQDEELTRKIGVESIREMAFDYFRAYLVENNV